MNHLQILNRFLSGIVRLRSVLVAFHRAAVDDNSNDEIFWPDIMETVVMIVPDDELLDPMVDVVFNAASACADPARRTELMNCNRSVRGLMDGLCNLRTTAKALGLAAQQDERDKSLIWPNLLDSLLSLVPQEAALETMETLLEGMTTETPVEAKPAPRRRKRVDHLNARELAELAGVAA